MDGSGADGGNDRRQEKGSRTPALRAIRRGPRHTAEGSLELFVNGKPGETALATRARGPRGCDGHPGPPNAIFTGLVAAYCLTGHQGDPVALHRRRSRAAPSVADLSSGPGRAASPAILRGWPMAGYAGQAA